MMICLVNPPQIKKIKGLYMSSPGLPLGLAYVSAALRRAGYLPTVVDAVGEGVEEVRPGNREDFLVQGLSIEEIIRRIPSDTTIVGISINFSSQWLVARPLLERIRACFPQVRIVAGGEHFTATPEYSMRSGLVDVCILGEGEDTTVELVDHLARGGSLHEVAGIAYCDADGTYRTTGLSKRQRNVDEIPWPDWGSFPVVNYLEAQQAHVGTYAGRTMPILGSRGCPYACTFCSNEFMWTMRWIPRAPRLVVDEMEEYVRRYGAENFEFWDLTAFVKRAWIVDFCRELQERRLAVSWQLPVGTRSEVFDDEVARLIFESGCRYINFAPESGSEEILRGVKKKIKLEHLLEAAAAGVRNKLRVGCFLVIGFPEDTPATLGATLRLVRRLARLGCSDITPNKFIPYPGSPLFKQLQREGKIEMDDEFFGNILDFYKETRRSYCNNLSARQLYLYMWKIVVIFYALSFVFHPVRMLRDLTSGFFSVRENTKYVKLLHEIFRHRARWKARLRRLHQCSPTAP